MTQRYVVSSQDLCPTGEDYTSWKPFIQEEFWRHILTMSIEDKKGNNNYSNAVFILSTGRSGSQMIAYVLNIGSTHYFSSQL